MNSTSVRLYLRWILCLNLLWGVAIGQSRTDKDTKNRQDAEACFFDAVKADMLENQDEAIRLLEKSITMDPENGAAHFLLASILVRSNKLSEALLHSKKATRAVKDNVYYWLQYAQLLDDNKEWKEAVKTYEYVIEHFEGQQQYRLSMAQIYIRNGKNKDALKELDKAQAFMGPSAELFQLRQKLYLQQNRLDDAIEDGHRWITALPDEPESYYSLAQLLQSNKKSEEAKKVLYQMAEKFPSNPTAHLMLADIFINEKQEDKADQELMKAFNSPDLSIAVKIEIIAGYLRGMNSDTDKNKALELCDVLLKVHPGDARTYIIRGDILNRANDKKGAREMYLKAKEKDRNNFGLWEQLVLIDLNLNEIDSMVKHTAEAKYLFPNTASFSFYNGLGNLMKKRYPEAIESLEHARRISLDNVEMQLEIHSQLGDAYYNQKENEKAWQAFDEALKIDSNNSHVLNNYSYFLSVEKEMLGKAAKMSGKLVRLHPDDPTFLDTYAWVLYQLGDYANALPPMEKAVKDSKSGVVWEHYGDILYRLGRVEEATNAWQKALDLGGENSGTLPKKLKDKKIN